MGQNIFRDLDFPEVEAFDLHLRSQLMRAIYMDIQARHLKPVEAAARFGVSVEKAKVFYGSEFTTFTIEEFTTMLAHAGAQIDVRIEVTFKQDEQASAPKRRSAKRPQR